jgi:hypothetical protein
VNQFGAELILKCRDLLADGGLANPTFFRDSGEAPLFNQPNERLHRIEFLHLRIPLKWGTDYGDVGQRRSEATLVNAMISEVPHLSQEFCNFLGDSGIISSPSSRLLQGGRSARCGQNSAEAGRDSATSGAGFR